MTAKKGIRATVVECPNSLSSEPVVQLAIGHLQVLFEPAILSF